MGKCYDNKDFDKQYTDIQNTWKQKITNNVKTAIDWFAEHYDLVGTVEHEQAKKMFKDQIENAYIQGFCECDSTGVMDIDKYYKENYGQTDSYN